VIGKVEPLPTMMDEGLEEFKGRGLEILPIEGVVWCEAPESATQSLIELWGGCSAMVLKEFMSDCWSQPAPFQGAQPEGAQEWPAGTTVAAQGRSPGCKVPARP
jgi:hypothetical protein